MMPDEARRRIAILNNEQQRLGRLLNESLHRKEQIRDIIRMIDTGVGNAIESANRSVGVLDAEYAACFSVRGGNIAYQQVFSEVYLTPGTQRDAEITQARTECEIEHRDTDRRINDTRNQMQRNENEMRMLQNMMRG